MGQIKIGQMGQIKMGQMGGFLWFMAATFMPATLVDDDDALKKWLPKWPIKVTAIKAIARQAFQNGKAAVYYNSAKSGDVRVGRMLSNFFGVNTFG